jgi:hypothetical protein
MDLVNETCKLISVKEWFCFESSATKNNVGYTNFIDIITVTIYKTENVCR